jgi:hypothetical protein
MAGLIDVGILKPELANTFGASQARQQAEQQNALRRQQLQVGELELKRLQEEREIMLNFQQQLKAAGKDTDLNKISDALIATGNPDYIDKGLRIRQKLKEQSAWDAYEKRFLSPKLQVTDEPEAAAAPTVSSGPSPFQANMLENKQNLPLNRLIPLVEELAPAPAPAPQVSKTPAASPKQDKITALEQEISMLAGFGDSPKAKARQQVLLRQLEAALKPEANRPIPLSPGQSLYSPTGQLVAAAPDKPEKPPTPTELQRLINERDALPPGDPRRPAYEAAIKKETTHSPGTTVSLPPQEKAEQGDRGKLLVKQYEGISEAARIGARSLPALQSNLAILDKGFETGFGTEAKAAGAKVLAALGVQNAEKYATNAQTFLGNASAAILQRQLEQKGPQTEADAQRITQTGAQLGNTKEANKFFINVARAQINRDIDQRNFYDRWWKANKTYDGAEDAWYAGEGGKSLFERPELKSAAPAPSLINQIPTGRAPTPAAAKSPAVKPIAAPTPIPQAAIDALKAKKGTPEQFDEIFGAGAAKRVLGGK